MKVVIIGGGSAGVSAATRLRRICEKAEIVILEKKSEFAIANCGLSYLLSGLVGDKEQLVGATVEQMRQIFKINVKLNHEVVGINKENKIVSVRDRIPESYDKLIIATGAEQLRPDIHGVLSENIFTMNSIAGVEKINDYYFGTGAQKVLIIGGGDIGIETAEAFVRLKADVLLVEKNNHLLPNFDAEMTRQLEKEVQSKGVKLYLGRRVVSLENNNANLDNGESFGFDMAIIATGVTPDVKLPILAGLEIGKSGGILVNKYMQTSDEDIYACGDNVEVINKITGEFERWSNASNALKQARVAVDHLCGRNTVAGAVITTNISKVFDYTAGIVGCSEHKLKKAGIHYQKVYLWQNSHASYYPGALQMQAKLLFAANGRILGMQLVGKDGVAERLNAVSAQMQHNGVVEDLIFEEIAFSPPYSLAKDIVNNAGSLAQEILEGNLRTIEFADLEAGVLPVDIRSPEVFAKGHLPGAINFPLANLRDSLTNLPKDRKIALYCNHGYGAYLAYQILSQQGFDNAYLLSPSTLLN